MKTRNINSYNVHHYKCLKEVSGGEFGANKCICNMKALNSA